MKAGSVSQLSMELRSYDRRQWVSDLDQGAYLLAFNQPAQVSWLVHIEHDDWQVILLAERECRHIHDIQAFVIHLTEGDTLVFHGVLVLLGVCTVDTIHAGTLQNNICLDFYGTQARSCIRGNFLDSSGKTN